MSKLKQLMGSSATMSIILSTDENIGITNDSKSNELVVAGLLRNFRNFKLEDKCSLDGKNNKQKRTNLEALS